MLRLAGKDKKMMGATEPQNTQSRPHEATNVKTWEPRVRRALNNVSNRRPRNGEVMSFLGRGQRITQLALFYEA